MLADWEAAPTAPRPDEVIAVVFALELEAWFSSSAARLVRLLAPSYETDPCAHARGYAALGALIRPLAHLPEPLAEPTRRALRQAALAALA